MTSEEKIRLGEAIEDAFFRRFVGDDNYEDLTIRQARLAASLASNAFFNAYREVMENDT